MHTPQHPLSGRSLLSAALVLGLASACDTDDAALLAPAAPTFEIVDGLTAPGPVATDAAELVERARAFDARLAEYRSGETGGVAALDPQTFARDLSASYNVAYGDLGLELPRQTTALKTFPLPADGSFAPADAARLEQEVEAFVREAAGRYDASAVRLRYVRAAFGEVAPGVEPGINVYVNVGVAEAAAPITGPMPWSTGFEYDDELTCRDQPAVTDYIVTQQNLALARQLRADAGLRRGQRIVADFSGTAAVTNYDSPVRVFGGYLLDADTLLQSLRYPRTAGGAATEITQPDSDGDFPEAGQFLVHVDQQFGGPSGEVCMSVAKATQYVRDYSLLADGDVATAWRTSTGVGDGAVRRVSLAYGAVYSVLGDDVDEVRTHIAQATYGVPYVVGVSPVSRIP